MYTMDGRHTYKSMLTYNLNNFNILSIKLFIFTSIQNVFENLIKTQLRRTMFFFAWIPINN